MAQSLWTEVDQYIDEMLVQQDAALIEALRSSDSAGLPPISVAPSHGKFLHLLARMQGARRILEIGTLGGYSAIWLARALPARGRLVTLEYDPKHADVARANLERAGVANKVDIRVGPALEILPQIAAERQEPFDFTFIDADKRSNPDYFQWALKLSRRGSVIVIDNVVRRGAVIDASNSDENIRGVRKMHELIAAESRVSATAVQTVSVKGYDGFTLALVVAD